MPRCSQPPQRHLSADVCICGGGPAGWIAAVAAARGGAKTILVERNGFPGGLATAGLVGPMSKFNLGGERIVGGIPLEFVERLARTGGAIPDLPSGNVPFDDELYKHTALRMLTEAGVQMLFHTELCGCDWSDGTLAAAQGVCRGTTLSIACKVAVDCTGTGNLVSHTSLPWSERSRPGEGQPLSLMFCLGGVDTDRLTLLMAEDDTRYAHRELREALAEAVQAGRIRNFGGPWALWGSVMRKGQISVNAVRVAASSIDPEDVSRSEVLARNEMVAIIELFREKHDAFRNCYLLKSASVTGYREGRRVEGLYCARADDVLNAQRPDDTIALGGHPVDRHRSDGDRQDVDFVTRAYGIPYRCLVPLGSRNLLVAGALVSADDTAYASMRTQAQCMAMGQAAGTAAALCGLRGGAVDELEPAELRNALGRAGAIL